MNVFYTIFKLNVDKLQFSSSTSCPPVSDSLIWRMFVIFAPWFCKLSIQIRRKFTEIEPFPDCVLYWEHPFMISRFSTIIHRQNVRIDIYILKFIFVRYTNDKIYHEWVTRSHNSTIFYYEFSALSVRY